MTLFSSRLLECMELKDMTAAELSSASDISPANISRYISGQRVPTYDNLAKLSASLGVSSDYLLGLSDVPESSQLLSLYSMASNEDKKVIWTLLSRYEEL